MSISIEDQETVIQLNRTSYNMTIWTSDTTYMTKLDKIYPSVVQYDTDGNIIAKTYEVNKKLLTFRSDPNIKPDYKPKRKITDLNLAKMLNARPNLV